MGHVQERQLEAEVLKRARQTSWGQEANLRGTYGRKVGEGEEEGCLGRRLKGPGHHTHITSIH